PLPLSSHPIASAENPNLMLGKSPDRDREIDDVCTMIRNAARAGIPALKYNMSILGVVRTEPTTVLGSVEGLKRFVEIHASAYHGLNFCQGTISEMLDDPGREIFDVIRYFGA